MTKGMVTFLQKRVKVDDNFSQDLSEKSSDDEEETKEAQNTVDISFSQLLTKEESMSEDEEETEKDILETSAQKTDSNKQLSIKIETADRSEVSPISKQNECEKSENTVSGTNTVKRELKSRIMERQLVKVRGPSNPDHCDIVETSIIPDRRVETVDVSMEEIRKTLMKQATDFVQNKNKNENTVVKFRSKIAPNANKNAEEELKKEISKDMFKKMKIIGQFNKGFIITHLDDDLFIIDQHATDEKYNFEMLQKTTVLENQKLVVPQPLELTAANETALMENIDVFKKNGFSFEIDKNAETGKKVKLTNIPMSKNWQLGKDDIDELLFMLRECPQTSYRPTRISAMFASRACRKSVMVGKDLSKKDMEIIVGHMAETEQPWNCPHGRPTMRHLVNLALLKTTEETSNIEI